MQGNGRERNRKRDPIHYPSTQAKLCTAHACKEQGRGWLCCQKNLARLLCLPSCCLLCPCLPRLPSRPPTHPFLPMSGWHGRRGPPPLCSGTANLAENLADGAGSFGSGPPTGLRPKSAPNWVTMMQAQRCIPNPHPHPNLCTHPPSVPTAEMRRDHERQIGKGPHQTMAHHD